MGKIYGKLLSIFFLAIISMSFFVSAYPEGAGTCNMDSQEIEGGHGASQLKSPGGYSVTTAMKSPGAFEFTVIGPTGGSFKGILAYVIDSSGKRVGEFTSLPDTIQIKSDCDASTTITHKSAALKKFPFSLMWNAPQGGSKGNLTVKTLVVRDQVDYARLDAVQFDPASGASSAPAGSISAPPANSQPVAEDSFLQKYSLFLVMVGLTTLLYVVGSITEAMLKRQQVKSRSFAKTINGFENSR